jgi:hypothetical protein
MCVYMHSRFVENHPIWILEDRLIISEVVLSHTPMGTTTNLKARGTTCIDNAPDTSSMAMCRTFPCHHREMASEGSTQSPHWVPLHRLSPRHGTVYTTRQYPILPYHM